MLCMRFDIVYLLVLVSLAVQVCLLRHRLVDLVALEYQLIPGCLRDPALLLIRIFHPNLVSLNIYEKIEKIVRVAMK